MANNTKFEERKKLIQSLKNGVGIKSLLNRAYEILGHPIVMIDTSYNLLSHTDGPLPDDPLFVELVHTGIFSQETVNFFNTEHFMVTFAESDIVSIMKSDKLKYDRMSGKLFDVDDVQLGSISVVACERPFEEGDTELVEILCEFLSVELQNSEFYSNIDRVYQESLIGKLIEGNIDEPITKNRVIELYDRLKANLYLAVVDITQYDSTNTHMAYFRDLFKQIQPEYDYSIYSNHIVILMSTDNPVLKTNKQLNELNEFLKKYNIYVGISGKFQNLYDAKKPYREAINALNYGLQSRKKAHLFRYDDVRIERFLHTIDDITSADLIHESVFAIQDYDKENNSSLLDTLYYYMLYGRDLQLASEALETTIEKLSEDLCKLEDLFYIDFKSGDMLYNIFLSIKMLDNM